MATMGRSKGLLEFWKVRKEKGINEMMEKILQFVYPFPVSELRLDMDPRRLNKAAGLMMRTWQDFAEYMNLIAGLPAIYEDGEGTGVYREIQTEEEVKRELERVVSYGWDPDLANALTINEPFNRGMKPAKVLWLLKFFSEQIGRPDIRWILPVPCNPAPDLFKDYYSLEYLRQGERKIQEPEVEMHWYRRHKCPPGMTNWADIAFRSVDELREMGCRVLSFEANLYIHKSVDDKETIWRADDPVVQARTAENLVQWQQHVGMWVYHSLVGDFKKYWPLFTAEGDKDLIELWINGIDAFYSRLGIDRPDDTDGAEPAPVPIEVETVEAATENETTAEDRSDQ